MKSETPDRLPMEMAMKVPNLMLPAAGSMLLQISAERLSALPPGVLIEGWGRIAGNATEMEVLTAIAAVLPLPLNLTDTVTAAVVAAKIVRPWLDDVVLGRQIIPGVWYSDAIALVGKAERMEPLTVDDLNLLARLARAAMEAK